MKILRVNRRYLDVRLFTVELRLYGLRRDGRINASATNIIVNLRIDLLPDSGTAGGRALNFNYFI